MSILAALMALALAAEVRPEGQVGQCDPQDGPGYRWTAETRAETRARVRAVCRHVRASRAVCAWLDASVVRESAGRPGVRHRHGRNEDGLGPLGLSLRWMRHHWPGEDEDPAFCQPEVSALVALAVARRAHDRFGALDLVAVQSIYGGHWRCYEVEGSRQCFPTRVVNPRLCAALEHRGVGCHQRLGAEDFGRWTPVADRRALAERLAQRFE